MANCKDCICVNVCSIADVMGEDYCCNGFKDRNRFVELPCKVGDTVYTIKTLQDGKFTGGVVSDGEVVKQISINSHGIFLAVGYWNELYSFRDLGITVFLTREEAGKALEGRSDDNGRT